MWEVADDLVENYGFHDVREQTNITDVWAVEDELHRQAIARALLEAHQRGRREGMEEAAKVAHEELERARVYHPEVALGAKFARDAVRAKAREVKT